MNETPNEGIGLGIALLLAIVALMVGLASGALVGGAAGYMVGQRLADDAGLLASVEQSAAAQTDRDAPTPLAEAGRGPFGQPQPEDGVPGRPPEGATPAMPGVPGIVLGRGEGPYLGVEVATEPITDATGAALPGAAILSVVPGTAAEEAGLLPGDRVVAFDGEPVADGAELAAFVSQAQVGDEIALVVMRGDEELSMTATLRARPGIIPLTPGQPNLDDLLEQMPPELRDQFRRMLRPQTDDSEA